MSDMASNSTTFLIERLDRHRVPRDALISIDIRLIDRLERHAFPLYKTVGSNAVDLHADISVAMLIPPHSRRLIPTGIAIHIKDPGVCGLVLGRSGLGLHHGIRPCQGAGLIDSDYTGEIKVPLTNDDDTDFTVEPGDRIAQLLFLSTPTAVFHVKQSLQETERGDGGFGSTGVQ